MMLFLKKQRTRFLHPSPNPSRKRRGEERRRTHSDGSEVERGGSSPKEAKAYGGSP
jgi:hypothetical protein